MSNTLGQNQMTNIVQPKVQPACCVPVTTPCVQVPPIPPQIQQVQQPQSGQVQNSNQPNYAGVNIQIFNPSVATPGGPAPVYNVNAPTYGTQTQSNGLQSYPSNYYTNPIGNNCNAVNNSDDNNQKIINTKTETITETKSKTAEEKKSPETKTEKRKIVQLTDEYIKNLENYLNSQDKEIRIMGAKEVLARFQEDETRKDDLALNALVNKMLQDPYTPVRVMALGALDSQVATGDDFTINLLKDMRNQKAGYGQDSLSASNILLKMSGQTVEKEFDVPVKDSQKTQSKG